MVSTPGYEISIGGDGMMCWNYPTKQAGLQEWETMPMKYYAEYDHMATKYWNMYRGLM